MKTKLTFISIPLVFGALACFGQGTNQSPWVIDDIIGDLITGNPTITGIVSNLQVEAGYQASFKEPTKFSVSVSEAYPLVKISKGMWHETMMFVHSNAVQSRGTPDEIGIGFNTEKHKTPKVLNPGIETVKPFARHGLFVNATVNTTKSYHLRFDRADAFVQGGVYTTF